MRILLISELSRLGRNVDEVLKNVMLCKERGLNVYFQKENLSIFDEQGKEHPFLTIFIAILGTVAQMERDNIRFRLDSGREMYKRSGGKLGIKTGYRKSKEQKQEQYAGVIKLLKKGYPVSQYFQDLRCQNLNCYEIEERVLRVKNPQDYLIIQAVLGNFISFSTYGLCHCKVSASKCCQYTF